MTVEAFAEHLLVVGGRAVRASPPGALAESAPKHAPRTREGDTIFMLVTPAEGTRAPASYFEELAQLGADVYFGTSGGITGGLREMIAAINQRALEQTGARAPVNVVAAVLRGSDVYTVRAGATFGLIRQQDTLASFPADRGDTLALNLVPLGTAPSPDMELAHYTVAPGQTMLLADASLRMAADQALMAALDAASARAAVDALKTLAGPEASASVIRFVEPGTATADGLAPPQSARPVRAEPARAAHAPALEILAETMPDLETPDDTPPVRKRMEPRLPAMTGRIKRPSIGRLAGSAALGDSPTSEPEPESEPEQAGMPSSPNAAQRALRRVRETGRNGVRSVLGTLVAITKLLTRIMDRILPPPSQTGEQAISTSMAVAVAVLVPLVLVIVVVGLALSEQGKTEFEEYLERAQSAHDEAIGLSGETCPNNQALRPVWVEVRELAERALEFSPNNLDAITIRANAQNYIDCLDGIDRHDVALLRAFEPTAELVGPILGGGFDLFTLDRANGAVYRDTLNQTGDRLTTSSSAPILRRGQTVSSAGGNFTVGDLIDIEWLPTGGTTHDNVLIALDRNGVLWSYSPTFFTTAQQLTTLDRWQNPVAIAIFDVNLYVLDPGANQIWRYVPPAGARSYSNAPEEYFNASTLPDLSSAVDFGISDEGAIYVLFADGTVKKYRSNVQSIVTEQPFNYQERPPGALVSGRALFVDNDPASASLYIVDAESDAVYRTSWSGRYNRGYRPGNLPDAFADVSGVYADRVVRNNIYVVSGNKLYHFWRN